MQKIVLIGKSCSGKTELAKRLQNSGLGIMQVSTTSRPMRVNEQEGVDYFYVTKEDFEARIQKGEFVESDCFNGWYYGLTHAAYDAANTLILTPRGLEHYIKVKGRDQFLVVFLDTSEEIRLSRAMSRGDDPKEVKRRLGTDDLDFQEFIDKKKYDLRITQETEGALEGFLNYLKIQSVERCTVAKNC